MLMLYFLNNSKILEFPLDSDFELEKGLTKLRKVIHYITTKVKDSRFRIRSYKINNFFLLSFLQIVTSVEEGQ
jgi:hypothetical protein